MHKYARVGGCGGMLPQKLDALRLLLRPFWTEADVVALHGLRSIASHFWLSKYALAKPADFEFL